MATLISEKFAFSGGKVDRSGPRPLVRGVLLCGAVSANRRRYAKEAFAGEGVQKYANKPVYINHGDGKGSRGYQEQIGWIRNPRRRSDGMPVGDIEVKHKHPLAELFLDDAERDPSAVGMSHVAHCNTSRGADGWEEVRSIERVESVDIVIDPATTKSLFENLQHDFRGTTMTTVRRVCERILSSSHATRRVKNAARRLKEEAADMGQLDAPVDDDTGGSDSGAITAAFKAACMSLVEKAFNDKSQINAVLSKLRKMFTTHTVVNDDDTGAGDDFSTDDDQDAEESRRRRRGKIPAYESMGSGTRIPKFDEM